MTQLSSVDADAPVGPFAATIGYVNHKPFRPVARSWLRRPSHWATKRAFDLILGIALIPFVGLVAVVLIAANRWWNRGPLIFRQRRMGRDGAPFTMFKFRSMMPAASGPRGPEDPVETDRVSRFGSFLRRSRIDELPQIFNVLKGEMGFVGPRPDIFEHALNYIEHVPHYCRRIRVRPGITGYAQVTTGYAEGSAGAIEKARRDAIYIRRASWKFELSIIARTFYVILTGHGAC